MNVATIIAPMELALRMGGRAAGMKDGIKKSFMLQINESVKTLIEGDQQVFIYLR
jgi:hypothetical protein